MDDHVATLTASRDSGWADRLRKYRVLVDGTEVGRLADGESLQHELQTGRHTVQAKIDWCGSRVLGIDVGDSGCKVHLRSALRGWRKYAAVFYFVFNWNGWVVAERAAAADEWRVRPLQRR